MEVRNYGKAKNALPVPNLVEIPWAAYERFIQKDVLPSRRKKVGLEALFRETFPIKSFDGSLALEYLHYELGQPRYTSEQCRALKVTYQVPLKARLRLTKSEPIEEEVYFGEVPLMIGGGEFIINGVERIIVNQLHRSPGIDFMEEKVGEYRLPAAWIVPERGSWLVLQMTKHDTITIRIDQGGKIPFTTFLRAMSPKFSTHADIFKAFYKTEVVKLGERSAGASLAGKYVIRDVIDPANGQVILESGKQIQPNQANTILNSKLKQIEIVTQLEDLTVLNTLASDTAKSHEEALLKIYSRLRPGMPLKLERAKTLFSDRFSDPVRYQLGNVGRFRINRKFNSDIPNNEIIIQPEDIVQIIKYLIKMRKGEAIPDDIDHLGNRRIRAIDELAREDIRKGFYRLKRAVTETLSLAPPETLTPRTLVNAKILSSAINHFFERSELSQVVDQHNPLSQLTHERRLSALGPGGLHRKRAGFEVRDVHFSHYGRICPIETPEGANIGLITSLGIFTRLDKYGFLVTPYCRVEKGRVLDEIVYLRADEEMDKVIVPADVKTDKDGYILENNALARVNGEYKVVRATEINYVDVSTQEIVGISGGLIPFLEHNDANRALMGCNMGRQAVPLMITEQALVATGLEKHVTQNSAMVITAEKDGIVHHVTADRIVVKVEKESQEEVTVYPLRKFTGLNVKTCLNQKPIVRSGDKIRKRQVIADGPATAQGELALGKNIFCAFMAWEGYNFEDAIVINERLLKDDIFTSIHIENFQVEVRESKMGREEFTRDIPNIPERALKNLDDKGIVRCGAKVKPGDILVGKIAPKSKSELTPEEKLLHAIFGKAGEDVKNESFEALPGVNGVVIDTQHFARKFNLADKEKKELTKTAQHVYKDYRLKIQVFVEDGFREIEKIIGKWLCAHPITYGSRGSIKDLADLKNKLNFANIEFEERHTKDLVESKARVLIAKCEKLINEQELKVNYLMRGDELPLGVNEMVKVSVAAKRRLSCGDKVAGRHGNKGVVARILPEEDMPYLADGTPVDILLNPLGVPSRMNIGQVLETHLGWAGKVLGFRAISPVFNGAKEDEITKVLIEAGLPQDGQVTLYDGRTGEPFVEKITVGQMYIMKLNHLVDDKIHARATGPYSLITQQPLGGKARHGGQRFGEMEVWALEAYGATHTLQEMLTVKSDDIDGRSKIYESMIKGENVLESGTPVSFEVLSNEIRGLGLNLKLEKTKGRHLKETL
ncbi:DNA-directed RNA polymerase subunit beta [Planctomycetota bacterium]